MKAVEFLGHLPIHSCLWKHPNAFRFAQRTQTTVTTPQATSKSWKLKFLEISLQLQYDLNQYWAFYQSKNVLPNAKCEINNACTRPMHNVLLFLPDSEVCWYLLSPAAQDHHLQLGIWKLLLQHWKWDDILFSSLMSSCKLQRTLAQGLTRAHGYL